MNRAESKFDEKVHEFSVSGLTTQNQRHCRHLTLAARFNPLTTEGPLKDIYRIYCQTLVQGHDC